MEIVKWRFSWCTAVRCSKCGGKAVISLRYARLALCEKHFIEFIHKRVRKVLEKAFALGLPKRVLVAVSGGKDSMVLLHILKDISSHMGFDVAALFIDLGIPNLSSIAREVVVETCSSLGIRCVTVELVDLAGLSLAELSKAFRKSFCATCGIIKRYIMNAAGVEGNYIVATGHHLDDIVTYLVKELLVARSSEEHIKVSDVVPPAAGASAKIRPLIRVSEREILAYAIIRGVKYVQEQCPYSPKRSVDAMLKKLVNDLEVEYPGVKLGILSKYMAKYSELSEKVSTAKTCRYCGLIALGDECAFCRYTKNALGKALGVEVREYLRKRLGG